MRSLAGCVLGGVLIAAGCSAGSAAPPPSIPAHRPDRNLPVAKLPQIPFEQLGFSTAELQREAKLFHDLADSMAGNDGRAERYKDVSHGVPPRFFGSWSATAPSSRHRSATLSGKFANGVDVFEYFSAEGRASSGAWEAIVHYDLGPQSLQKFASLWVMISPVAKPGELDRELAERRFFLTQRHVQIRFAVDRLHYELRTQLQPVKDPRAVVALLFSSPEELRDASLADLESLRKLVRKELAMLLTVYDDRHLSSANPPRPMPVNSLTPDLEARVLKLADAQIDADAELLRKNFRDFHSAIQNALPRELFAAEIEAALQE